ncbi:MAG: hypothetical protein AVDCRST_MAG56-6348, partial [uncultured Cytophagales bacterium]
EPQTHPVHFRKRGPGPGCAAAGTGQITQPAALRSTLCLLFLRPAGFRRHRLPPAYDLHPRTRKTQQGPQLGQPPLRRGHADQVRGGRNCPFPGRAARPGGVGPAPFHQHQRPVL